MKKILITTGGSGGHVIPSLSIYDALKDMIPSDKLKKYIDIFILLSILMSIMRIISIITNGFHITPFTVLAYPPEFLAAPVLFFIKTMLQKKTI